MFIPELINGERRTIARRDVSAPPTLDGRVAGTPQTLQALNLLKGDMAFMHGQAQTQSGARLVQARFETLQVRI